MVSFPEPRGGLPVAPEGLLLRPGGRGGVFRGGELVGRLVVLRWHTDVGTVALTVALDEVNPPMAAVVNALYRRHEGRPEQRYAAVVTARSSWGADGLPELDAVDLHPGGEVSARYRPTWRQVAGLLGCAVPWWHPALRDAGAVAAWAPGAGPAVVAAAEPGLDPAPLAVLAAGEPAGSLAGGACLALLRQLRARADAWARQDVAALEERGGGGRDLQVAALPAPLRGEGAPAEPAGPAEESLRGWEEVLGRPDVAAHRAAALAWAWDGGRALGTVVRVDPRVCAVAAEWAALLVPVSGAGSAAQARLAQAYAVRGEQVQALRDPGTSWPVLRLRGGPGDERLGVWVGRRLPADAGELEAAAWSHGVGWVRAGGRWWPAPRPAGAGASRGAGGRNLALLVGELLGAAGSAAALEDLVGRAGAGATAVWRRAELLAATGG
ncbi:hypothetical protein [Kitasatospora sp. NPDC088783]|uniref:hypothetical protein n=1 Tax=Kitasatospora sp. NPDC088783 TaxID=3364077 RepID=UPI00382A7471